MSYQQSTFVFVSGLTVNSGKYSHTESYDQTKKLMSEFVNSLQSSNPYRRVYEIEIDTFHCSSSYSAPYAHYKQLPKACEPTDKSRLGAVGYVDRSIDVYQNLARIRRKDPKAIIVINAHIAPFKKYEEKNLALLERLSQLPNPPTFIALDNKAADYAYVPYKFIKSVKWVKISGETKGKEGKNGKAVPLDSNHSMFRSFYKAMTGHELSVYVPSDLIPVPDKEHKHWARFTSAGVSSVLSALFLGGVYVQDESMIIASGVSALISWLFAGSVWTVKGTFRHPFASGDSTTRDAWYKLDSRYHAAISRWMTYELDAKKAEKYPLMLDVSHPAIRTLMEAITNAGRLKNADKRSRYSEEESQFYKAVLALEMALASAEEAARDEARQLELDTPKSVANKFLTVAKTVLQKQDKISSMAESDAALIESIIGKPVVAKSM